MEPEGIKGIPCVSDTGEELFLEPSPVSSNIKALAKKEAELKRAKKADLITFPSGVSAVNCSNCKYVKDNYCTHPEVDQVLKSGPGHMCCNLWDQPGTKREWEQLGIVHAKAMSAYNALAGGALVGAKVGKKKQQGLSIVNFTKGISNKDQYTIKVVDGFSIRNSSLENQEFGNAATYIDLPHLIPRGEIWIDSIVREEEQEYMVAGAIRQMESHAKPDDAYDEGVDTQRKQRPGANPESLPDYYLSHWGTIHSDGIKVYLVDARKIRNTIRTEWEQGGNGYAYAWVPKNCINLESTLDEREKPIVALHEYTELVLMRDHGLGYNEAHDKASKIEFAHRTRGFTKEDMEKLTPDIVKNNQ